MEGEEVIVEENAGEEEEADSIEGEDAGEDVGEDAGEEPEDVPT